MIILNEKQLALALAKNQVSEKNTFYYLILDFIISFLPFYLATLDREQHFSNTYFLIDFILVIAGTYVAFVINSKGDNKDFLKRYICLSIPVAIKMIVISISIYIVIYTFFPAFNEYKLLSNTVYFLLEVMLYAWLAYALAIASGYMKKKRK